MAGGDSTNTGNARNYTSSWGQGSVSFQQLYDSSLVLTNVYDGSIIGTGGWRAVTPADFSEVIISGAQISIGAVSVTGNPIVQTMPVPFASPGSTTVSGTTSFPLVTGIALQANPTRKRAYIQNISSGSNLWIGYGFAPSVNSLTVLLGAAGSDNNANGGFLIEDAYTGSIFVSGSTRFTAWQV